MAIKAVVTNEEYDGLDEAAQSDYKAKQGGEGYILDVEGVDEHPLVKGLATSLRRFKEAFPDAAKLKRFLTDKEALEQAWTLEDGTSMDPDVTRDALTRLAELESGEGKIDVGAKIEAAKTLLSNKHKKELEAMKAGNEETLEALGDRDGYIDTLTVRLDLDKGLQHVGIPEERRKAARALIVVDHAPKAKRVVNEETGKVSYETVVKTDVGEVTLSDFFERWIMTDEARDLLPPSGNQGTLSRTADGQAGTRRVNPWLKETQNLTQQGQLITTNPKLAESMARAAGVELNLTK